MIIKSMTRKAPTFGSLIAYIDRDADEQPTFSRNLYHSGKDHSAVERQFRRNFQHLPTRKNGNALYHEIVALEPQPHLSNGQIARRLHQLADRYCQVRAPHNLVWGKVHHNTEFPHVHLMISANAVQSDKRTRHSKQAFSRIQIEMENYAVQKLPELRIKPVYSRLERSEKLKTSRAGQELQRRTGQPLRKEAVAQLIQNALAKTSQLDALKAELSQHGLALYKRGRNWGAIDQNTQHRYRLRNLGVSQKFSDWMHPQRQPQTASSRQDPQREALTKLAEARLQDFERQNKEDRNR